MSSASAEPSTSEESLTFLCPAPRGGGDRGRGGDRTHRRNGGHDFAGQPQGCTGAAADHPGSSPMEWSRHGCRSGGRLSGRRGGNHESCGHCFELGLSDQPEVPEDHGLAEGLKKGGSQASIPGDPRPLTQSPDAHSGRELRSRRLHDRRAEKGNCRVLGSVPVRGNAQYTNLHRNPVQEESDGSVTGDTARAGALASRRGFYPELEP